MHCTSPKNNFRLLGSGRSYWGNKLLTLNSHNFFDTWNWGLKLHQSTQNRELRRSTGSKPISRLRRCSPQGVGIGRGTRGACSETVANIDENLLKFRCFLSSQISAPRLGFFPHPKIQSKRHNRNANRFWHAHLARRRVPCGFPGKFPSRRICKNTHFGTTLAAALCIIDPENAIVLGQSVLPRRVIRGMDSRSDPRTAGNGASQ